MSQTEAKGYKERIASYVLHGGIPGMATLPHPQTNAANLGPKSLAGLSPACVNGPSTLTMHATVNPFLQTNAVNQSLVFLVNSEKIPMI
jgi:hypothetical protein